MALVLTGGLAWLGSEVVALDRRLEQQRTRERLGHALDLVVVSLSSWLDKVHRDLAAFTVDPDAATDEQALAPTNAPPTSEHVFVVVSRTRMVAWPEGQLAYMPGAPAGNLFEPPLAPPAQEPPADPLAAAAFYREVARSSEGTARATALLGEAAALRRAGRHDAALAVYDQLAKLPVSILDAPAAIVALHARCLTLAALDRREKLAYEAEGLLKAVRDPRHDLTRRIYTYYSEQARRWIDPAADGSEIDPAELMRIARASLITELTDAWHQDPTSVPSRSVRVVRLGDEPMLLIQRGGPDGLAAFVTPARILQTMVSEVLVPDGHLVALAVLDLSERVVAGELPATAADRITRTAAETGLPWTLIAAPGAGWGPDREASERQRLILVAVLLVGIAVVAGAWMAGRAMHHELEAARLQADFVATVSHEFRTPLAAFTQITELLADGRVATEADRDEYYRRLQHETTRLRQLVEDLLDFRRMEAGAHEYRFEPVEIDMLVRDIVDECQSEGVEDVPRIEFTCTGSPGLVRADREALARAIRNLIDNALKYAPGTPLVNVSVARTGWDVSIGVCDTGPGIAPAHQQAIFQKFVRGGAHDVAVRGTGLGLAMVQHIVSAHGGRIDLRSDVGEGSTFTVTVSAVGAPAGDAEVV